MVAPRAPPELAENIISLYNQYCMVNEAVIAEAARTGAAALDPVTVANRLRPVLLHLNRHLRQELHALGIGSSQVSLLAAIQANPGIGVGELATREGTSAPSVCNHIDRLEASGLVTRTREDGGDRRRVGPPDLGRRRPEPSHGLGNRDRVGVLGVDDIGGQN